MTESVCIKAGEKPVRDETASRDDYPAITPIRHVVNGQSRYRWFVLKGWFTLEFTVMYRQSG